LAIWLPGPVRQKSGKVRQNRVSLLADYPNLVPEPPDRAGHFFGFLACQPAAEVAFGGAWGVAGGIWAWGRYVARYPGEPSHQRPFKSNGNIVT